MATMLGVLAAWAAFPMALLLSFNAFFSFTTGAGGWTDAGAALALVVGSFRTLRKMSGGLRLLAAAWGFTAALFAEPLLDLYGPPSPLAVALALIAFAGAALTVLHKEKK